MRIIKRYRNRRLYDTETSRTIAQFDLAKMIRQGIEVKIIDSASGIDISAAVLGRVMLNESNHWSDAKDSIDIFSHLIATGGNKTMSILKNTVLASIGMLHVTKAKAEKVIDDLIKRGDLDKSKRKKAVMELIAKAEASTRGFRKKASSEASRASKEFAKMAKNLKWAKQSDLQKLEAKINKLVKEVKSLKKK